MLRIEHVALWVQDLERMREFYVTHFGATAGARYHNPAKAFSSYFLSFGEGCRLELMHRADVTRHAGESLGYAHLALTVGSREGVDQRTDALRRAGVSIASPPRQTGDGYYESVVLDPEGNRIELVA